MNSDDIAFMFIKLKDPERYKEREDIAKEFCAQNFTPEKIAKRRKKLVTRVKELDSGGLLEDFDLTPDSFLNMVAKKDQSNNGGKAIAGHLEPKIEIALKAFLKAEKQGRNISETVDMALSDLKDAVNVKTIRRWLQVLQDLKLIEIHGDVKKRGRPKKD
jgi:hypothetical protein